MRRVVSQLSLGALGLALWVTGSFAQDIRFEDVSRQAGTAEIGATAASAWGDLNADGWPDLWISNHHGRAPSLYLNNQDGSFTHLTQNVEAPDGPGDWPDLHGAAWADVDNDGDQDLLIVTGGGAGQGESANVFYINNGANRLLERAAVAGLDYPLGRGRTPLWIDANLDGLLDVIVMNKPRKEAPSRLFLQDQRLDRADAETTSRFISQVPLPLSPPDAASQDDQGWWESLKNSFINWFSPPAPPASAAGEFAQIGHLLTNTEPMHSQLIAYGSSVSQFGWNTEQQLVRQHELPSTNLILDAAVADFNNDLRLDWLVMRARPWAREARQSGTHELLASLAGNPTRPQTISFVASGEISIAFHRPWIDPSDPRINDQIRFFRGQQLLDLPEIATLSSSEVSLHSATADTGKRVSLHHIPAEQRWKMSNSAGPLNLVVTTNEPIESLTTTGFSSSDGAASAQLYLSPFTDPGQPATQTFSQHPCVNVAVADFDNDTDLDAYAVCTSATNNTADILLLNDGNGKFSEVSLQADVPGRGNQVATADFDRDGKVDVLITNGEGAPPFSSDGPLQLLRNTTNNDNHWLQIDLQGRQSNRDGIGAEVVVVTATSRQMRVQNGGMHSFSQNHQRLHFGLGGEREVTAIEVTWPNGTIQKLGTTSGDQILIIRESASSIAPEPGS